MKHKEITHIWASRTKPNGKCGNIFFEGASIYSYGKHFKMAEFVQDKTGKTVVLLNPGKYSVSTSTHQSFVRQAIPDHIPSYECTSNQYYEWDYEREVRRRIEVIETLLASASRARKNAEFTLRETIVAVINFKLFTESFELEVPDKAKEWFNDPHALLSPETMDKLRCQEEERKEKELIKKKKEIEEWLAFERNSINVPEVFLRCDNGTIETSLGANVPTNEGKALYRMIKNNKPVHGFKIGYYTVNSYSDNVLTVGCHKLKRKEIDRFAQVMKWAK